MSGPEDHLPISHVRNISIDEIHFYEVSFVQDKKIRILKHSKSPAIGTTADNDQIIAHYIRMGTIVSDGSTYSETKKLKIKIPEGKALIIIKLAEDQDLGFSTKFGPIDVNDAVLWQYFSDCCRYRLNDSGELDVNIPSGLIAHDVQQNQAVEHGGGEPPNTVNRSRYKWAGFVYDGQQAREDEFPLEKLNFYLYLEDRHGKPYPPEHKSDDELNWAELLNHGGAHWPGESGG